MFEVFEESSNLSLNVENTLKMLFQCFFIEKKFFFHNFSRFWQDLTERPPDSQYNHLQSGTAGIPSSCESGPRRRTAK